MTSEAAHVARKVNRVVRALVLLAIALVCLAAAITFDAATAPDRWSPLGPYPVQQVLEPRDNTDTPFVSLADPVVHVAGEKCTEGDGYTISGTVSWQSMDPRGTSIVTGSGSREAVAGCTEFEYRNDIPPDVVQIMRHQVEDGLSPLWRITGTETPQRDGEEGVSLSWSTEPFRIVP
jgi:hypothetical protein